MNNETNNKSFVCEKTDEGFSLDPSFFTIESDKLNTERLQNTYVSVQVDKDPVTEKHSLLNNTVQYIPSEEFKEALFQTHHFVREQACYSDKNTSPQILQTSNKGSIVSLAIGAALLFLTAPALGLLFCLLIMTLWIWKQDAAIDHNIRKFHSTAFDPETFEVMVHDTALLQHISGTEALVSDLKRVYTQPLSQQKGETLHSHIKKMLCIVSDDLRKTHLKNDTQQILNTILTKNS